MPALKVYVAESTNKVEATVWVPPDCVKLAEPLTPTHSFPADNTPELLRL